MSNTVFKVFHPFGYVHHIYLNIFADIPYLHRSGVFNLQGNQWYLAQGVFRWHRVAKRHEWLSHWRVSSSWSLETWKNIERNKWLLFFFRWFFVWFRDIRILEIMIEMMIKYIDISNIMTSWYTDCNQILLSVDLLVMCLRRKAASPRNVNNAHQLPGSASRLTPLELDANLQADPSASYHMETKVRLI